jgi:hypothetical protein
MYDAAAASMLRATFLAGYRHKLSLERPFKVAIPLRFSATSVTSNMTQLALHCVATPSEPMRCCEMAKLLPEAWLPLG